MTTYNQNPFNQSLNHPKKTDYLTFSLSGYPPFSEELKKFTLHEQIIEGIYSFPAQYWSTVSEEGEYNKKS